MAPLKELRERISSVKSASKITTAMQMVASSKLKKAAKASESFVPYQSMLYGILRDLLVYEQDSSSAYVTQRKIKNVTILAFASNSGFAGSFNSAIINRVVEEVKNWKAQGVENIKVISAGKKLSSFLKNVDVENEGNTWDFLVNKPNYAGVKKLADYLMTLYKTKKTDKIVLIYFHYKNSIVHELKVENYLPIEISKITPSKKSYLHLYIVEPQQKEMLKELLPKVLRSKIYAVLLDSFSSEQSARTIAMQAATDNANNLINDLTIKLNRTRQQLITMEILDLESGLDETF